MAARTGQLRGCAPRRVPRHGGGPTAVVVCGQFAGGVPQILASRTARTLLALGLGALTLRAGHGAAPNAEVEALLDAHCAACHDSATHEAGLDLTTLAFEPADRANLAMWVRVHDRVTGGEMPPADQPRPTAAEVASLAASLGGAIAKIEQVTAVAVSRS